MARILIIYACSLLLAVITYHDILYTEGRPIKSLSKGSQRSENKDDHWSATPPPELNPGVESSVAEEKEPSPAGMQNYSVGFGDPTAVYDNDFQPTPPGHSPGVGHPFVTTEEDIQPKELGSVRHSVTAHKDDYRPTEPGHSPGVGHSLEKPNAEPYIHA